MKYMKIRYGKSDNVTDVIIKVKYLPGAHELEQVE